MNANDELMIRRICRNIFQRKGFRTTQDAADTLVDAAFEVYSLTRHGWKLSIISSVISVVRGFIYNYLRDSVSARFSCCLGSSQRKIIEVYQEAWQEFITSVSLLKVAFRSCDTSWAEFHGAVVGSQVNTEPDPIVGSVEVVALDEWRNFFFRTAVQGVPDGEEREFSFHLLNGLSAEVVDLLDQHRKLCYNEGKMMENCEENPEAPLVPLRVIPESEEMRLSRNTVKSSTSSCTTSLVNSREREREIKGITDTLSRLRDALKVLPCFLPSDFFMADYLHRMISWYDEKCRVLSKTKCTEEYMQQMNIFLQEEVRRAAMFFSDGKDVVKVLRDVMLKYSPEPLTEETLFKWMNEVGEGKVCPTKLRSAFKLMYLQDKHENSIETAFENYAKREVGKFILRCKRLGIDESSMEISLPLEKRRYDTILRLLIVLLRHLERIVCDGFMEHALMQGAIDTAFQYAAVKWSKVNIRMLTERLVVMTHSLIREEYSSSSPTASFSSSCGRHAKESAAKNKEFSVGEDAQADIRSNNDSRLAVVPTTVSNVQINDIFKAFHFLCMLGIGEEYFFFREYQQLLAKRLLIFTVNDEKLKTEAEKGLCVGTSFFLENQGRVERRLLAKFATLGSEPLLFSCYRMLSSSWPVDQLMFAIDDRYFFMEDSHAGSHHRRKPCLIRVRSRLISKSVWGITDDVTSSNRSSLLGLRLGGNLPLVGFLQQEADKEAEEMTVYQRGRNIYFSAKYTTCVVKMKVLGTSMPRKPTENLEDSVGCATYSFLHLKLHLTWVQAWIVLSFNKQHVWEVSELQKFLEIQFSDELVEAFTKGLKALCDKKILHERQDGDKFFVLLENPKGIPSDSLQLFQRQGAGQSLVHHKALPSLPECSRKGDGTPTYLLVSVIPDDTVTTSLDLPLPGSPQVTRNENGDEKERVGMISRDDENATMFASDDKKRKASQRTYHEEDSEGAAKVSTYSQIGVGAQLLRLVKKKGCITLSDLYTAFTDEVAPTLPFFAPISLSGVKAEVGRLVDRGIIQIGEGEVLSYVP